MQIKSVLHETAIAGVKLCVYGPAGVGKTVLGASMPNPIFISAERGLLSLRAVIKQTGIDIPYLQVENMVELQQAFDLISGPQGAQFQSVVLDSISEIGEVCLATEQRFTKDGRAAYGGMNDKMLKIIRDFRDLDGKHVLFIAKQSTVKDELTGIVSYAPSMPGNKITEALPYFFDELFHMFISTNPDKTEYRGLQTALTPQAMAKDRSRMLDAVEYPDMNNIINKIISQ